MAVTSVYLAGWLYQWLGNYHHLLSFC